MSKTIKERMFNPQNPFLIHKLEETFKLTLVQTEQAIKMIEVLGNAGELARAVLERSDDDNLIYLANKINK